MDPTFASQFSRTTQTDILQWADHARLRRQGRAADKRGRAWPPLCARHLALALYRQARRLSRAPRATLLPRD